MEAAANLIKQFTDIEDTEELDKQLDEINQILIFEFKDYLTENQLAALISLTYGIGLEPLFASDIPDLIRSMKYISAANKFMDFNKNGRVASPKKTKQRKLEQELFNRG